MNKILIVLKDLRTGSGVVHSIMNYYESISNEYDIDFLLLDNIENNNIKKIKGNVYYLPTTKFKYSLQVFRFLKNFFMSNTYDIVHINITGPYAALILRYSKKYNVLNRVYHCHCPREKSNIKSFLSSNIFTNLCVKRANIYIACSESSGKNVFKNNKFLILKNRINVSKYQFSNEDRKLIRSRMNISNKKKVLCTVGRIEPEKNPFFMVDVIYELSKKSKDFCFFWIGEGSLKKKIELYSKQKHVDNYIKFIGVTDEVEKWYSASDIFILPSKYEGLGLVLIEAQCSGLICYTSNNVPIDTKISNNIYYYDLNNGATFWANNIYSEFRNKTFINRIDSIKNGINFDINHNFDDLKIIYKKILLNEVKNNE